MNYDVAQQLILNTVLAVMVFGVALELSVQDFVRVIRKPKGLVAGLAGQFLLLPWLTLLITLWVDFPAAIELGMMLVACCPGGAMSNVITHFSGGNSALSMSMTAVASLLAIILLPINFSLISSLNAETASLADEISVQAGQIFVSLLWVLAFPLVLGMLCASRYPTLTRHLRPPLKIFSVSALLLFIAIALIRNSGQLEQHFLFLFVCVVGHNGLAFMLGNVVARLMGESERNIRAITIEVGMQNSSLALAIIFVQFDGQSQMALIGAFWGVWHLISGVSLALFWRRRRSTVSCDRRVVEELV